MGTTIDKCVEMFTVKIECIKRATSGTDIDCNLFNCDKCSLYYKQGTIEEYEEALKFIVNTMHKYQKIVQIMNVGKNSNNTNIVDTWLYENISKVLSEQGELEDVNDN